MDLISHIESRGATMSGSAERSPIVDPARFEALVAEVGIGRPRVLDAWEATALVESFGYTDARARHELGFSDTLAAGREVYLRVSSLPAADAAWVPKIESLPAIILRSAASTLIYAVPWLTVFIAQIFRPDAMRLPARAAPAITLALMFSLIWSGGCVQAIVRRGQFYVGLRQLGLAREVVDALLQIGVVLTVSAALLGMLVGWYFELFAWPALVLSADAFIIMSVLWMVCGVFAIRQQQWRVSAAFVLGFVAFAISRALGADVLTAHLVAAGAVLMSATLQTRRVFAAGGETAGRPPGVPFPRVGVLVYWTVPYFWYGTAYFAFLFADRLTAGTAQVALTDGPFGVPAAYNLGMELALLTLLIAASGVEVAGALFARAIAMEAVRPFVGDPRPLAEALGRHHRRVLALALGFFGLTAIGIVALAERLLPGELTPRAWSTLLAGDIGYACLAVGFVNALILFETQRPWMAVQTLTTALAINLAIGYLSSHMLGSFYAVNGLLAGGGYFALASTIAVRRTLRHPDYTYAVG